jgi:hypothetical protein
MERKSNVHVVVDDVDVIGMLRRSNMRRLKELAGQYIEGQLDDPADRVTDSIVSPGLKLKLKSDRGTWKKGMLWTVTDPHEHPTNRTIEVNPDQLLLTHVLQDGNVEDIVVLRSELDDMFELR